MNFYSDKHILHYSNDTAFPYRQEEIRHFLSTTNDQRTPLQVPLQV